MKNQKNQQPNKNTDKTDRKQNPPHLFQPGQSGNPAGRPPGSRSMTTLLKEAIIKVHDGTDTPFDALIIKRLMLKAAAGDIRAIEIIFDRMDGKVSQQLIHDLHGFIEHGSPSKKRMQELVDKFNKEVKQTLKEEDAV